MSVHADNEIDLLGYEEDESETIVNTDGFVMVDE